jgi:membrane protein YqaA with SNARE-associated domain
MPDAPAWLLELRTFLLALGLPGLAVVAFVDSGLIGVPAGPDALVMLLAWRDPSRAVFVVTTAALGAIVGGFVRYGVARKAGKLALKRFDPEGLEWARRAIDRYGMWSVFLACLAPPPFPLSLMIIAAGAFQMRPGQFLLGTIPGRFIRYGVLAYAGIRFGNKAAAILAAHLPEILGVFGVSMAIVTFFVLRHQREKRGGESV